MAITTEAGLQAAIQDGKRVRFYKVNAATALGVLFTSWRLPGSPPAGTTPTTTGAQLTRTSLGALAIPAASGTSYIAEWEGIATNPCTVLLADRLVEYAGLVGNVTTAQTVSALALPARATGATDVELWLEVFTSAGATAPGTVTASYTNQAGTSGRTATITGLPSGSLQGAGRNYQFNLQAGDIGVQSVQSLTLGTSTAGAGDLGLVLRRTMLTGYVPAANLGFYQSWAETDLQQCADAAALEVMWLSTSQAPNIAGAVRLAQG